MRAMVFHRFNLESRVFMVGSADGGRSFTNQELASDLEHFFNDFNPSNAATPVPNTGTEASSPQIVFSQGGRPKAELLHV